LNRLSRAGSTQILKLCALGIGSVRGVIAFALATVYRIIAAGIGAAASLVIAFTSWIPALLRLGTMGLKLVLICSPFMIASFFIVCALANPFVRVDLDYAHDRSTAAEVFDSDGHWLGILPPAFSADWSDGTVLPPDHVAVLPVSIPPVWLRCISYLEDRSAFDGISNWLGFNPAALLKAGVQTVLFQKRRGASTLLMQVVRTLNGQSPRRDEPWGAVALRKAAELVGATTLARMLHDRDPKLSERYIGMHLPLIIGTAGFGDEISGIELAARILFGKSANDIPPEEQAILAAAVKTPIVLAPPGDGRGKKIAQARWERVKLRAQYCLDHGFPTGSPEIVAARQRLASLSLPAPKIDPQLKAELPADPREAWKITVNPVRRALYFAAQALHLAKAELDQTRASDWRAHLVAVQLTTSAANGRALSSDIIAQLRGLQARVPGVKLDLTNYTAANAAQVVIAVADDTGRVREFYSSDQGLFLTRKTEMGSTAKMIAAVVLSRRTSPRTAYCRAPIPGMALAKPEDTTACREHWRWLTARDAFARSVSPAVNWALRHYAERSEMERTAAAFGLPDFGDVPPATALSLGIVQLTPAEMLRMTGAIGSIISGRRADVPFPTVISDVTYLDAEGVAHTQPVTIGEPLRHSALQAVVPARARAFLTNVLVATSDPGGTLASLGPLKTTLHGALYAKTGTVSIRGDTQALQIAGVFKHDGRLWPFSVMIASPNSSMPLGRKLAAGQFASLVPLLVRHLLAPPIKYGVGFVYAMDGEHARHPQR
jgi:membrane peptidoglycan carboxypeptidase